MLSCAGNWFMAPKVNRWFKVRIVTEFDVNAPGPKTAIQIVLDNLRDTNIELDELEFEARDMRPKSGKAR